jgi:hypothetical protein
MASAESNWRKFMTDNIVQLPTKEEAAPELLIGPFTEYRVVVDGRVIPRLTGRAQGDMVSFTVDGRFGAECPKEYAYGMAWLIAQAFAIGEGYPHLGADTKDHPFAPVAMAISTTEG